MCGSKNIFAKGQKPCGAKTVHDIDGKSHNILSVKVVIFSICVAFACLIRYELHFVLEVIWLNQTLRAPPQVSDTEAAANSLFLVSGTADADIFQLFQLVQIAWRTKTILRKAWRHISQFSKSLAKTALYFWHKRTKSNNRLEEELFQIK